VTSSVAVFEAATWVKSNLWQNRDWNPEKRKYGNQRRST